MCSLAFTLSSVIKFILNKRSTRYINLTHRKKMPAPIYDMSIIVKFLSDALTYTDPADINAVLVCATGCPLTKVHDPENWKCSPLISPSYLRLLIMRTRECSTSSMWRAFRRLTGVKLTATQIKNIHKTHNVFVKPTITYDMINRPNPTSKTEINAAHTMVKLMNDDRQTLTDHSLRSYGVHRKVCPRMIAANLELIKHYNMRIDCPHHDH